jgi:hypothetical protein
MDSAPEKSFRIREKIIPDTDPEKKHSGNDPEKNIPDTDPEKYSGSGHSESEVY